MIWAILVSAKTRKIQLIPSITKEDHLTFPPNALIRAIKPLCLDDFLLVKIKISEYTAPITTNKRSNRLSPMFDGKIIFVFIRVPSHSITRGQEYHLNSVYQKTLSL